MGLTKQYLAYKPIGSFNIIVSGRPNINFIIYDNIQGRYILVGAAENAVIWDLKLNQKIQEFKRDNHEVTALRASPDRMHIAVGYIDGVVKIFNIENPDTSSFTLTLHKTAVSVIRFDNIGMRMITGGLDTEIVESDMVTQSGRCRLIGHNAAITDLHFLDKLGFHNIVVSSSKDMQIKFWNLETHTCFKTLVDNRTEIWNLGLIGNLLVVGCGENSMTVYKLDERNDDKNGVVEAVKIEEDSEEYTSTTLSPINVRNYGTIQRSSKGRVVSIVVDNTERILSCHGTNDIIESFYFYTKEETLARTEKRLKKIGITNTASEKDERNACLADEVKRLPSIKTKCKIKSLDILMGLNNELRICVSSADNSLFLFSIATKTKNAEPILLKSIMKSGHHSEVRTITFSSDSMAIASGSGESLKIWNSDSMKCIKTIPTEYILCCCFAPGDRYVVFGTKTGNLIIADIGTGDIVEEIQAHQKEIWSICLQPNLKGFVTGSSDTTVKFWDFELLSNSADDNDTENNRPISMNVLSVLHKNTLKLEESILCVKISPNSKFIAVGLLDHTVKIFFMDSLKFYLSLYDHKLPVLCMDISYDSNLIVTGSADRNVKVWGMDFGDRHCSMFAHDDSVMSVQFIPKTHMFFSCGKDGKIKQWDADSFKRIITLPGHIGEAYNLVISPNGRYLASCGSDRSIRLFEETEELIVLQDVEEDEREQQENQILATGTDDTNPLVPGLKLPSRKTIGSEAAAESILECLDICEKIENPDDDTDGKDIHPLMMAYNVDNCNDFLSVVFQRIRASDLEEALMILPFTSVCKILERLPKLLKMKNQSEFLCKVTIFIFKVHHKSIISNHTLIPIIGSIVKELQASINKLRDTIGFNYHGLQLLQRQISEAEGIQLFRDSLQQKKKRDQKYKKRELTKRLHIQMN